MAQLQSTVDVVSDLILDLSVTSVEHRQVWLSSLMFVPIHPKHPKSEVEYLLRDSAADIVLVHPSLRSGPGLPCDLQPRRPEFLSHPIRFNEL